MNNLELKALCILLMCDDPTSLTDRQQRAIVGYANRKANGLGFDDWVGAYHNIEEDKG